MRQDKNVIGVLLKTFCFFALGANVYAANPDMLRAKTIQLQYIKPIQTLKGPKDETETAKVTYYCSSDQSKTNAVTMRFNGINATVLAGKQKICPSLLTDDRFSVQRMGDANCDSELQNFPALGVLKCPIGDGIRVEINDPDKSGIDDTTPTLLNAGDLKCFDNNILNLFFGFGTQDTYDGFDSCFDSKIFQEIPTGAYDRDPMVTVPPCIGGAECQDPSHMVTFKILDDVATNKADSTLATRTPMIEPKLHLEVEFLKLENFKMYANDNVVVNMYLNQNDNVRNWQFYVSPQPDITDICLIGKDPIGDEIRCQRLSVVCDSKDDVVHFTAMRGGVFDTWQYTCGDLILTSNNNWDKLQNMVNTFPFTSTFNNDWNNRWRERAGLKTDVLKQNIRIRFKPFVRWNSNELGCYTGQNTPYVMPSCALFNDNKVMENIITPEESDYKFAPEATPTVINQLCQSGLLKAQPLEDEQRIQNKKTTSDTNQAMVKDQLTGMTFCPVMVDQPVVKTMGIIFDRAPRQGKLMAKRKIPEVVDQDNAQCLKDVDWTEEIQVAKTYKVDDYEEFYVDYDGVEAPKTEASIPTLANQMRRLMTWPMIEAEDAAVISDNVQYKLVTALAGSTPKIKLNVDATVQGAFNVVFSSIAALASIAYMY